MIVCVCNNVSEREIIQAAELGADSVADLRESLGVASCCGKCHSCAHAVLKNARSRNGGGCANVSQPV